MHELGGRDKRERNGCLAGRITAGRQLKEEEEDNESWVEDDAEVEEKDHNGFNDDKAKAIPFQLRVIIHHTNNKEDFLSWVGLGFCVVSVRRCQLAADC